MGLDAKLMCSLTRKLDVVSEVTVQYRDGLPVVTVPLPSRRESCEFTLKPISHTVADFLQFIREEDGGIDRVSVYKEGKSFLASPPSLHSTGGLVLGSKIGGWV